MSIREKKVCVYLMITIFDFISVMKSYYHWENVFLSIVHLKTEEPLGLFE